MEWSPLRVRGKAMPVWCRWQSPVQQAPFPRQVRLSQVRHAPHVSCRSGRQTRLSVLWERPFAVRRFSLLGRDQVHPARTCRWTPARAQAAPREQNTRYRREEKQKDGTHAVHAATSATSSGKPAQAQEGRSIGNDRPSPLRRFRRLSGSPPQSHAAWRADDRCPPRSARHREVRSNPHLRDRCSSPRLRAQEAHRPRNPTA